MSRQAPLLTYIPRYLGLFLATAILVYHTAESNAVGDNIPLSSTSSIGSVHLLVAMGVLWLIGFVIGHVVVRTAFLLGAPQTVATNKFVIVALVICIPSLIWMFYAGAQSGHATVAKWQPRVITDSLGLDKQSVADVGNIPAALSSQPNPFEWQNQQVEYSIERNTRLTLSTPGLAQPITYRAPISYITQVRAQPVNWRGDDYLAVLMELRATSQRSVLVVFDSQGAVVYEELLTRCSRPQVEDLARLSRSENSEIIVNQCDLFSLTKE